MQIAFATSPRAEGQEPSAIWSSGMGKPRSELKTMWWPSAATAPLSPLHTLVGETKPVFAMRLHGSVGHLSNGYSLTTSRGAWNEQCDAPSTLCKLTWKRSW